MGRLFTELEWWRGLGFRLDRLPGSGRHEGEPGCAVHAALDAGTLDPGRVENRRKLLREQEFLRRKVDPKAQREQREQWKKIHRAARQKYQQREKDGGKR
jgi:hypothetical protein